MDNKSSKEDIGKLVAILSAAYPNWNVNEFTVEVYYQDLKDIPSELLFVAATQCRTEPGRKFAPSTGEILGAVWAIRSRIQGVPSQYEAWQDLLSAGNGQRTSVEETDQGPVIVHSQYKFLHEIVQRVAEQLGWPDRFPGPRDNEMADRAHFYKAYEQAYNTLMKDDVMPSSVKNYIAERTTSMPALGMGELAKKLEVSQKGRSK